MAVTISGAVYDSISLDVAGDATGLVLAARITKADSRLFIWDETGDILRQYSKPTGADIDDFSFDSGVNHDHDSSFNQVTFTIENGGTLLFAADDSSRDVRQSTFSAAWDITGIGTTDYSEDFGTFGIGYGLRFKPDGTKVYIGDNGGQIEQHDLSTPWDLTTKTLDHTTDLGSISNIRDFALSQDGKTLLVFHEGDGDVSQWTLGTAWDMSTASDDSIGFTQAVASNVTWGSIDLSDDETKLYLFIRSFTDGTAKVYQYDIGQIGIRTELDMAFAQAAPSENVRTEFDMAFAQASFVRASHRAMVPIQVAASHRAMVPIQVAASHRALVPARLGATHRASIPLRVSATHRAIIRERLRRTHRAVLELLSPVRSSHRAQVPLEEYTKVRATHRAMIPLRVSATHRAPAALMAFVRASHRALWDLRVDVRASHRAAIPILDHDPVRSRHRAVWPLLAAPRTHIAMNATLTRAGQRIPLLSWTVASAEGGYLWEGELGVGAEGYGLLAVNDAVTLDLFGEAYLLVVDNKRRDRDGPAGRRYTIGVLSPTARFDFPRAEPVTVTFDQSVLAKDAVEQLLGEAVTWELVNWRIPAFRLAFEDASPIAAARQVVEAAGGTLCTDPDGTLRARHLYPASPKNKYADVAAARTVDDQDDVVSAGESYVPRRLVDRLEIRDTVEGVFNDRLEFVEDEADDRAGTVHVYPSPWRTNLVVTHTSNASLQLTHLGEVTREVEPEVVEFVAGRATLQYPVDTLIEVTWLYVSLGGVTFEPYSTELQAAGGDGYALARVRYQTRSIDYHLVSPTVDQAQLKLEEIA